MYRLAGGLFIFAVLVWSQEPLSPAKDSLPVPLLDKGSVQGKTYKNNSVGLELTPDTSLRFGSPELKGKRGTASSSLTVSAWGRPISGSAREGTAFWAVPLAFYPADQRSTDACMRRVIEANVKDGFKPVEGFPEAELDGVVFARTDFVFQKGPAYEAVFVKACETLALGLVFTGSSRDAVNKLVATTGVKLDLSTAACAAKTGGATPKMNGTAAR